MKIHSEMLHWCWFSGRSFRKSFLKTCVYCITNFYCLCCFDGCSDWYVYSTQSRSDSCWFCSCGVTINARYYINCFTVSCTEWFGRKDYQRSSSYCMTMLVHILQIWERWYLQWTDIMNHPLYSSNLTPIEGAGQEFQIEDELKCRVLNWVCSRAKTLLCCWHE